MPTTSLKRLVAVTATAAVIGLSACSPSETPKPAVEETSTPAVVITPSDASLAKLYEQTCKACHTSAQSGAPQTGSESDWAPRMAQGMDTLLTHTLSGYKGMPPLGLCMDCTEDDFVALIEFMANGR